MDWRIAIGPNGVRDLGRRDRVPELAVVDDLLNRTFHGRKPPKGAAGINLRLLRHQEFDMLNGWTLHRRGWREELCIGWLGATDIFIFQRRPSGLRLLSIREGPQAGCPGKTNS